MKRKYKSLHLKFLEPLIAVVFWLLLFLSPLLFGNFEDGINWDHIFRTWRSFIPYLFLFLVNRYVFLPYIFLRGKRWLYFISNAVLIGILATGLHFHHKIVIKPRQRQEREEARALRREVREEDRLAEDRFAEDRLAEDRLEEDRLAEDRLEEDRLAEDRLADERLPEDGPPEDGPPEDRPQGERPQGEGPPGRRPPGEGPPGPGGGPAGPGGGRPLQQPARELPPYLSFIVISILIIGFDTGLKISVKWAQSEQKRMRAEKDSVESQLAFLQNQVSPHFFMNTLNNIHSLIDIDTSEAKKSIIKLSKLMRHLLYDSQVELIPLKKEIAFIQNYVELMQLRFSEKVRISLYVPEQMPEKLIPPLLFTSFVENAFKHGISYQEKSFIDISFSNGSNRLSFSIRNSNPAMKKEDGPSGIGIENSRKRLDLIYGDTYTLEIDENNEAFTVNLNIPV